MKETIKNSIIGAFALFGLFAVISAATTQNTNETTCGTPESHEWEIYRQTESHYTYLLNKRTGEVKKFENSSSYYVIPKERIKK